HRRKQLVVKPEGHFVLLVGIQARSHALFGGAASRACCRPGTEILVLQEGNSRRRLATKISLGRGIGPNSATVTPSVIDDWGDRCNFRRILGVVTVLPELTAK